MERKITWLDWAFVLHNPADPIEIQTGEFITGEEPGLLIFRPFDKTKEEWLARKEAFIASGKPGTYLPTLQEKAAELGRRMGEEMNRRVLETLGLGPVEVVDVPAKELDPEALKTLRECYDGPVKDTAEVGYEMVNGRFTRFWLTGGKEQPVDKEPDNE